MTVTAAFCAGAAIGGAAGGTVVCLYLRRRQRLFGRLLSFAMHELNTPVTAVNMTVLNLLSDVFGELPAPLKPWVEMTREQVGRLNGLVGEIRDFVHIELHQDLRVGDATLTAQEILDEALVSIKRGMEQAGVEFKVELGHELPPLRVDPDRAARCLSSVLFHARKFRTSGPIVLSVARVPAGAAFAVTYTGPRLKPGTAEESLELYYPAEHRNDQILAATGLGLGLIRKVLQLNGGDLSYRVDEDGRATVTVQLAAAQAVGAQ